MSSLSTNLAYYWKLDGNSNDSIGSNNGTDTTITYQSSPAKITQSALFNGTTSKIEMASTTIVPPYSLSCWVYPTSNSTTGNHRIFEQRYDTSLELGLDSTGANFEVNITASAHTVAIPAINTWHHLVVTVGSGTATWYLNNALVGSFAAAPASVNFRVRIGNASVDNSSVAFPGNIDEVAFWTKVLTVGEIGVLYNNNLGLQTPFNLTATTTSFSLTGVAASLIKRWVLTSAVGSFLLTGYNVIFTGGSKWVNQLKNTTDWNNQTKN